jgi:ADP-heptose:LPS heptosyltransferase
MKNIENVYAIPREMTKNPIKLLKEMKKINKNSYDLVINPVTGSVSTNIATLLVRAKLKLGFYKPNTWTPVNRSLQRPEKVIHEALRPLTLMDIFSGEKLIYNKFLDIDITEEERAYGKQILENSISKKIDSKIIAIFRDARNEKKIENDWWISFVKQMRELDKSIVFIDILAPNEKKSLLTDMPSASASNLRELAKIFSALDAFICGDTGPMHLASAALTPTIAFFNATDPSNYGPLGEKDKAIDINKKDISMVAKETYEHIKNIL